jgi:outer membrane protein
VFSGRVRRAVALTSVVVLLSGTGASAESLKQAMGSSYTNNPNLNAARAELRSIDEQVPKASSGYRPTIGLTADVGAAKSRNNFLPTWSDPFYPRSFTFTVVQPIFQGFRTKNAVKMAKTSVLAAREQLKGAEQQVLLQTVQAFMNVVLAQVVLNLRAQNVTFLREQVRAAQDRLNVGEGTRTDVAQSQASLAAGQSAYAAAVADLQQSIAVYIQVVGHRPQSLGAANGFERLLPRTMEAGLAVALASHPDIVGALYNIDVAGWNVKIAEGAMMPTLELRGALSRRENQSTLPSWNEQAQVTANLTVPLYQGGEPSAEVRRLKEVLGQQRINLDASRDAVRAQFVSAWANFEATTAQVQAAASQVAADQLALSGVIEERKVGQRTTLDVLNAQQSLLNAQVSQVTAQHDRVIAGYQVLSAAGLLTAKHLGLAVDIYDPTEHYDAVKDKWFGLRTPEAVFADPRLG